MSKYKNLIISCICIIILIIGIIYAIVEKYFEDKSYNTENIESSIVEENTIAINENLDAKEIIIHIAGEVNFPGIISLKEGSRIIDAIECAGGLTENADLTNVNLAYEIEDAQKIYIPSIEDEKDINIIKENGDNILVNSVNKKSKININKATEAELQTLSGIGLSTAKKIIQYRIENGSFVNIEDIKNVPGIGESKFDNIKNEICTK